MSRLNTDLPGPDFLDNVAEAELHNGNDVNAHEFRKRATEWRGNQRELEELRAQNEELRQRLAHVQSALVHGPRIRGAAVVTAPGARQ